MASPTPTPSTINSIAADCTVAATDAISEGILLAFSSCEDSGNPLTDLQKQEVLRCMMFCTRDMEADFASAITFLSNPVKYLSDLSVGA